ncbi:hypothetical protein MLD38_014065 [Melastoma candidum]|uniref:Uncharacterized protein n=1 Tax=Melastoma candidum TaxID=119954 RepID=A0ACB9RBN0_9MYRT|nr:hypothetical protein MLD38_014065 [Melastoma candidum]
MGMGFGLHLKWDFPLPSPFLSKTPLPISPSSSVRSKEISHGPGSLICLSSSTVAEEAVFEFPSLEDGLLRADHLKVSSGKTLLGFPDDEITDGHRGSASSPCSTSTSSRSVKTSRYSLLMENLSALEHTLSDLGVVSLERNILLQLGKLGALDLFHSCLSEAVITQDETDLVDHPTPPSDIDKLASKSESQVKRLIASGQKEMRKEKRERRGTRCRANQTSISLLSLDFKRRDTGQLPVSITKGALSSKNKRLIRAQNEVALSRGVKFIADLEGIRLILEKESGMEISMSSWAKAAGMEEKTLRSCLRYGWYCRDEILRSSRSLIVFLARNYWSFGVAVEDLIQAGKLGVLHGAEKFDPSRGYRFSTYVQYWIRKSMSRMVGHNARAIRVPYTLSGAIYRIERVRKNLNRHQNKHLNDMEIAKLTGLTVARVSSASKCLRVVGSLDQKVADCISMKYMEVMIDPLASTPEETVMKQNARDELHSLLDILDYREKRVLVLRYGLENNQRKSLEEIGKTFRVTKEWIRKIERRAVEKLRNHHLSRDLSHYQIF